MSPVLSSTVILLSPFKIHFTAVESIEEVHSLKLVPLKSTMASEGTFVLTSTETIRGFGSQISVAAGSVGSSFTSVARGIVLFSFVRFYKRTGLYIDKKGVVFFSLFYF
jgi:uncharacterized membrane protein